MTMAKQANRMMIGGFVVIAVFLLAASVVIFGSGKFFQKTNKYVIYFDGSIKGLEIGAPVLFQGVPIGTVSDIALRADISKMETEIPVIVEIAPDRLEIVSESELVIDYRDSTKQFIDKGLRAILGVQSLITGKLLIELDFYPGTPVNLRHTATPYPEVPTLPSTTERLAHTFQKLDFEGMQKNLQNTLNGIENLVSDSDLKASIKQFQGLLSDARGFVQKLDGRFGRLSDEAEVTMTDVRKLVNNVDQQVTPTTDNLNRAIETYGQLARNADRQLESVTGSLDKNLAAIRSVMSEDAPLIVELEETAREVSAMARAFRQLAEYLERHPESLIQGKGDAGGK
jgi:paraquat-inducible protein B